MQNRKCPKTRFYAFVKKCSPAPAVRFGNFFESRCPRVTEESFLGVIEIPLLEFMFLLFEKRSGRFFRTALPDSRKVLLNTHTRRSGYGY